MSSYSALSSSRPPHTGRWEVQLPSREPLTAAQMPLHSLAQQNPHHRRAMLEQSRLQELKCWGREREWSARELIATPIGKGGGILLPQSNRGNVPGAPETQTHFCKTTWRQSPTHSRLAILPTHSRLAILSAILELDRKKCVSGHKARVPTLRQTSCGVLSQLPPSACQFPHF